MFLLKASPNDLSHFFKQARKNQAWVGGGPRQFGRLIGSSVDLLEEYYCIGCFFQSRVEQIPFELIQLWMCLPIPTTFNGEGNSSWRNTFRR